MKLIPSQSLSRIVGDGKKPLANTYYLFYNMFFIHSFYNIFFHSFLAFG